MKEKIKALLERLWAFLVETAVSLWTKFKATKVYSFLRKWGLQMINFFALALACIALDWATFIGGFVSLWAFILLAYYLFWKLFGMEKLFPKDEERETPIP
jgi:hypothetical protein